MGAAKDNTKAKDQAMAARMAKLGIKRTTGRCPVCHNVVSNGAHIMSRVADCHPKRKGQAGTNASVASPA